MVIPRRDILTQELRKRQLLGRHSKTECVFETLLQPAANRCLRTDGRTNKLPRSSTKRKLDDQTRQDPSGSFFLSQSLDGRRECPTFGSSLTPKTKQMGHTHTTRVSFGGAFTTKLNEAGTLEVYYQGQLVGDIYNTDDRPLVLLIDDHHA